MTLKECYEKIGGDYEGVLGRLRQEARVQKFVLKFLDDKSYGLLKKMLEEKNYEEAFRAAHTIKGVCQNLSFDKLYVSSSALTEDLRNGTSEKTEELFRQVTADYEQTIKAISEL